MHVFWQIPMKEEEKNSFFCARHDAISEKFTSCLHHTSLRRKRRHACVVAPVPTVCIVNSQANNTHSLHYACKGSALDLNTPATQLRKTTNPLLSSPLEPFHCPSRPGESDRAPGTSNGASWWALSRVTDTHSAVSGFGGTGQCQRFFFSGFGGPGTKWLTL